MKIISLLLFLISVISVSAALPTQLPLNKEDARIYAIASASYVERQAWASPIGQVQLFSKQGVSIPSVTKIHVLAPSNSKKLVDAVNGDQFKFKLPKMDSKLVVRYIAYDKFQNPLLDAQSYGGLTAAGTLDAWAQKPVFTLSYKFRFQSDADQIGVITVDSEGLQSYHNLERETIGGKNYFSFPSWWFDWSDFKNGLTTAYGYDENGTYAQRQYNNATGKIAETNFVNYTPVAGMDNHFTVTPTGSTNDVNLSIPMWGNYIQNPSFELPAVSSVRTVSIGANTVEGNRPLGIVITEQDAFGNLTKSELPMLQGIDYNYYQFMQKANCTYFFRFVWGSDVDTVGGGYTTTRG